MPKKTDQTPKKNLEILPVIPVRQGVLFPHTESILTFGRPVSLNVLDRLTGFNSRVILLTQKDGRIDNPTAADLYHFGVLSKIEKKFKTDQATNALVRGMERVKIKRFIQLSPIILVEAEIVRDEIGIEETDEIKALFHHLQKEFQRAIKVGKPVEFLNFMRLMGDIRASELTDQIASTLNLQTKEKQALLEMVHLKERMLFVSHKLAEEIKVIEIEKDVVNKTQQKFDKHMRENVLRERMHTIQKELGELGDEETMIGEYTKKLKKIKLPQETKEKIQKEIKKLERMSPHNPEAGYIQSWLETILSLPWDKKSKNTPNLTKAAQVLNKSHYGLKKVKDRIMEYIAVLQLKQKQKKESGKNPNILCFVGPPGVGKTSIGQSIAQSLGRKFVKISLGGIRDEAEIRGHRRTYVGAMPGRIIKGIKQAGTNNPVFMLDEIDKVGNDYKGDPASALLEALDPEQNVHFEDHYLDVPFDLSNVMFITTANTLDTIPSALRDRLEIIRYSGYTEAEKFQIAKKYLVKKARSTNGLSATQVNIKDETIKFLIQRYSREAGVRELERLLNSLMRKVARKIVENKVTKKVVLTKELVKQELGPEKFDREVAENEALVGQATGLAWTRVGGEILFIEVALTKGKGVVKLTGKLGDVMKESAQAALTYVKAHASQLKIDEEKIQKTDVHIHVPEGAVPKDGPSAGITIASAIVSAFSQQPVRQNVAMTGEITLRGRILRIGGLKEKSIAAHQAGITTILIPADNERDLVDIPTTVKKHIQFIPVKQMSEVLDRALVKPNKKC